MRQIVRNSLVTAAIVICAMAAAQAADDCLSCHASSTGLVNSKGQNITLNPESLRASVHNDLGCLDCHAGAAKPGHTAKTASASCLTCHPDAAQQLSSSAHAALGAPQTSEACIACHGDHKVAKPKDGATALCITCHEPEVKQFSVSIHGQARGRGNGDAPSCKDCHGPAHQVLEASNANSPVNDKNLPQTCGHCHSNPALAKKYLFAAVTPVEAYEASVHARAIRAGKKAAACDDCHGTHGILPASDPRSPISKANVANTCAKCHEQVFSQYAGSIHGRAVAAGVMDAPTCTSCHGEHDILAVSDPNSPVYVTKVSQVTCSRCHADTRLARRFNLPAGQVSSYESSYHGLAAQAGSQTVANCASCHGVHNILPSSDPRSTVAKTNLATTCGKCHPDAGKRFALGPIHVLPASAAGGKILEYVRGFYLFTIPTVLGFMLLHNLVDWWHKARRSLAQYRALQTPIRLSLNERLQHLTLLVSFFVLVMTGFALKFPSSFWAAPIVAWEKDYPIRGLIHRIAAVLLTGAAVYHVIYLLFTEDGRRNLRALLPKVRDMRDAVQTIAYNLGYRPERPLYPKFNYAEKVEYWALVWGTIVMFVTGVVLWAHNFVLEYFPKWVTDVSTAVHYYEAILATAAIVIWHFYAVIFDPEVYPLKWTVLTGRAPKHEVREEEETPTLPPSEPSNGEGVLAASPPAKATKDPDVAPMLDPPMDKNKLN
jgi:formate dehydrogenase gamma subunit